MKTTYFYLFFVFCVLGCIASNQAKKHKSIQEKIEISGHFYRHVPYQILFPIQNGKRKSVEIASKHVYVENKKYDTLSNIIHFNISEELFSSIIFHDKSSQNSIEIKPITAKHPPILIELVLDKYYRSGDTISILNLDNGGLVASVINFDIDLKLPVKEFGIYTIQNGTLKSTFSIGPHLAPKQIEALNKRDKNTPIIFSNIIVESINETVKVDPLVFFVGDK
ncbi:MAG: hypothetical protein R3D58_00630 [Saprospiraceae bacterium]